MNLIEEDFSLTPLEYGLLEVFHFRYSKFGFPPVRSFVLKRRESNGAGRFTWLDHPKNIPIDDGVLYLGNYSHVEMDNLEAGVTVSMDIENRKVKYLELIVNGEQQWDGKELNWKICDPDTGE